NERRSYTMTDLGTLQPGGSFSGANGINPAGIVVGQSNNSLGQSSATVWKRNRERGYTAIELGMLPGGSFSQALGISPSGVAGGSMGSVARAINPAGVVAGGSDTSGGSFHATVWKVGGTD